MTLTRQQATARCLELLAAESSLPKRQHASMATFVVDKAFDMNDDPDTISEDDLVDVLIDEEMNAIDH